MEKKIGRNDNCPCGSGLKYKKCCLNRGKKGFASHQLVKKDDSETKLFGTDKIMDEDGKGFVRVFRDDIVEKVNPIEYYLNWEIKVIATNYHDFLEVKDPFLANELPKDYYVDYVIREMENKKLFQSIIQREVPSNFLKLFETSKKKEQLSLLKGMAINPDQLITLVFKSYSKYGFLYSRYRFKTLPKNFNNKQLPKLAHIKDDGTIKTTGKTDLKEGEIKNLIEHRKVIVAHFFDKGDVWHCLFSTYDSIAGRERWKGGQPHYHYISSAFGFTREEVLERMKSGNYITTPVHIEFVGYRDK